VIEEAIRPWLQDKILNKMAYGLIHIGLQNPNQITMLSCFFGLLFIPLILSGHTILAIISLLVSGLLDILDGSVARILNKSSSMGTVYDIMSDRIVEAGVVLGLLFIAPDDRAIASVFMLISIIICVTSFLVVGIVSDKITEKTFDYSPGLMERPEAFIFFILMVLLPRYFNILAYTFTALVLYTAAYRVFESKQYLSDLKT
jgi:phosphatidylglycerophosphate synthase